MPVMKHKILLPKDVTVKAACEDVDCDQRRHGWETVCDESTREGAMVANWIRSGQSGRAFTEFPPGHHNGRQVSIFRFEAGQRCFREHRTRPVRFLAAGREVPRLADWGEHLADHLGDLQDQRERG